MPLREWGDAGTELGLLLGEGISALIGGMPVPTGGPGPGAPKLREAPWAPAGEGPKVAGTGVPAEPLVTSSPDCVDLADLTGVPGSEGGRVIGRG